VGWVLEAVEKWNLISVAVDETGLGASAVDFLRERLGNIIYPVSMVGNERREVYSTLQSLIENRQIVLPKGDERLLQQFSSFKVEYASDGRILIKKTRGVRDDIVDALALCCFLMTRKRSGGERLEYVGDVIKL
jgi:phage FluMu gp28-like protein